MTAHDDAVVDWLKDEMVEFAEGLVSPNYYRRRLGLPEWPEPIPPMPRFRGWYDVTQEPLTTLGDGSKLTDASFERLKNYVEQRKLKETLASWETIFSLRSDDNERDAFVFIASFGTPEKPIGLNEFYEFWGSLTLEERFDVEWVSDLPHWNNMSGADRKYIVDSYAGFWPFSY